LAANKKNRAIRSEIKSSIKQVATATAGEEATKNLSALSSLLDKAVKSNIVHKRAAARKKSRLTKRINKTRKS